MSCIVYNPKNPKKRFRKVPLFFTVKLIRSHFTTIYNLFCLHCTLFQAYNMTISIKLNDSQTLGTISTKEFKDLKKLLKTKGFTLRKPYQADGIKWMVKRERSSRPFGLLCDDPGLGKTLQTIATLMVNQKPRTLIAVPTCVLTQWKDTLETLIPGKTFLFHGPERPQRATLLRNILTKKTIVS